jgi:hypothetical protein
VNEPVRSISTSSKCPRCRSPPSAVEHHDLVAAGAARHTRLVPFARPFHEYLYPLPDQPPVAFAGDLVENVQQPLVALLLHLLGQLTGQLRRRRVPPFRVPKDERLIELRLLKQRHRLLKVVVGLAGKPDNDIGADAHARLDTTQLVDDAEVALPRVAAVHGLEHPVASALHREVRALNQFRQAPISLHQIVAITLRVR